MGGKIAYFMKELEICAIDPEMGITTLEHVETDVAVNLQRKLRTRVSMPTLPELLFKYSCFWK
jgi:hypothetical protein